MSHHPLESELKAGESSSAPGINTNPEQRWPQLKTTPKKKRNKKKNANSNIQPSQNTELQSGTSASDTQVSSSGSKNLPLAPICSDTDTFTGCLDQVSPPPGTSQKVEPHTTVVFNPAVPPPGYPPIFHNPSVPHAHGEYLYINTSVPPPPYIPINNYSLPPPPIGSSQHSCTTNPPPGFAPLNAGPPPGVAPLDSGPLPGFTPSASSPPAGFAPSINSPPTTLNKFRPDQLAADNKLRLPIRRSASQYRPIMSRSPLSQAASSLPSRKSKSAHNLWQREQNSPSSKPKAMKKPPSQPRSHEITGEKHPPTNNAVPMKQQKIVAKKTQSTRPEYPSKNVSPPQQPTQYKNEQSATTIPNKTVAPCSIVSQGPSHKIPERDQRPLYSSVVNQKEKREVATILPLKRTTRPASFPRDPTPRTSQITDSHKYQSCSLVPNRTETKPTETIKQTKTITPAKEVRQQPSHKIPPNTGSHKYQSCSLAPNQTETKPTETIKQVKTITPTKDVRQQPSHKIPPNIGSHQYQSCSLAPNQTETKPTETIKQVKTISSTKDVRQHPSHKIPPNTSPDKYQSCPLVPNETETKPIETIKEVKTITPTNEVRQHPLQNIPHSAGLHNDQLFSCKSLVNNTETNEIAVVKEDKTVKSGEPVHQLPPNNVSQSTALQREQFYLGKPAASQEPDSKDIPPWRRVEKDQSHSPTGISNRVEKRREMKNENAWKSLRRNHQTLFTHECNNEAKQDRTAERSKHLPICDSSWRNERKCDTDRSDESGQQRDTKEEDAIATPAEPAIEQPLGAVCPLDTLRKYHPYLFVDREKQKAVPQSHLLYIRPWRYLPKDEDYLTDFQQPEANVLGQRYIARGESHPSAQQSPVPPLELDSQQPAGYTSSTNTCMPGPPPNQLLTRQVFRHPAAELYEYLQSVIGLPEPTEQLSPKKSKPRNQTKQAQTVKARTEIPTVIIRASEARRRLYQRHLEWLNMQQSQTHADDTSTSDAEMRASRPTPQFRNAPSQSLHADMLPYYYREVASPNETQVVCEPDSKVNNGDIGKDDDPSASGNGSALDSESKTN